VNDVNFLSAPFGPSEDDLFFVSSKVAQQEGIPRIFLAGNSGAL
jgi:hypothetical protein